jgi:FMN phosphatase YigB (HAD superfamily)
MSNKITHILTDLDNTLYNWVDYYVPCFLAMVKELSLITQIEENRIKQSFKRVHERHRTTEYSFAIEELDVLASLDRGLSRREVLSKYDSAINAFRSSRKRTLRLYSDVVATLREVHSKGVKIVAVTESLEFHATRRLKQLGIEDFFTAIVCHPDHGVPPGTTLEDFRFYKEEERYTSSIPVVVRPSENVQKPDVRFLAPLFDQLSISPKAAMYVGDSLTKDILMAQRSGISDVYAAYGKIVEARNYAELLKITYWTDEDVAYERELSQTSVHPSATIETFGAILDLIH